MDGELPARLGSARANHICPTYLLDRCQRAGDQVFLWYGELQNSFSLDSGLQGRRVLLDLGEMRDVAEVFVNGKSAGILWAKPFSVDISALVRGGENKLRVEVVNMWVNRLVGDKISAASGGKTYCRTNHYYMGSEIWPGGDEPYRIQTSGLLGPVRISFYE